MRELLGNFKIPGDKIVLTLALVLIFVFFSMLNINFISTTNIINILLAASLTGLVAIGMTYLIIGGHIDLSAGAIVAFSGVLAGILSTNFAMPFPLVLVIILLTGAGVGVFNTIMVTKIELNPFIATLVTQSIFRGFAYILNDGRAIPIRDSAFTGFGTTRWWGIPIPVILLVALFIIFGVVLAKTTFGRNVYVVGGNKEAARLAGLNPNRIALKNYVITGVLCALGGVILAARMGSGQPAASMGLEFDAITAVILGGVSFAGGVGSMFGTVLGVLILQSFNTGLIMVNVPTFWQFVARGVLLLLALSFDFIRKKAREKKVLEDSMKKV
ncbi:MAG: ABC transporter permease [Defluviitaleaceae bacterium]|nr:ABC transporter permease [Defluviitaleaceae bacterium]